MIFVSDSWSEWFITAYLIIMFVIYETDYTLYSISTSSYVFLSIHDSEERIELSIISTYITYLFSAVITAIPLVLFVGDAPTSYIVPAIAVVITLNAVLYWVSTQEIKDRPELYNQDYTNADAQLAKNVVLYTIDILKSKGFLVTRFISHLTTLSVGCYFTLYLYYMDDIINATSAQSLIIDTATGIIAFLIMPFIPTLSRSSD